MAKRYRTFLVATGVALACAFSAQLHADNDFDKDKDLLVCQFDNLPDADDIHAQAALASFLAHADQEGVDYFCVAGAYGTQVASERYVYDDTEELMSLGFGPEAVRGDNARRRAAARWVSAHGEIIGGTVSDGVVTRSQERIDNMDFASDVIAARAKPILEAGGRVFVTEAGQSDITADWVEKLVADGVPNTQSNVILVQHSAYNRSFTAGNRLIYDDFKDDWGYLTNGEVNTFVNIDDGNSENDTPAYVETSGAFLDEATGNDNPNPVTRAIWAVAERLADASPPPANRPIVGGGVDFSDFVEVMWVFDLADESDGFHTVRAFWDEYVTSEPSETPVVNRPEVDSPEIDPPGSVGLVASWKLDEGEGQNVSDSSGNGNDGTLVNGNWSRSGAVGGSASFDGGNEGVQLPASAFDTIDDEITLSLWANGDSVQPVADTIFNALDGNGNRVLNIHLPWSNSQVIWDAGNDGNDYDRVSERVSASLYEGGWNHWVFTKDADEGVMNVYANGTLFATESGNVGDMSGIVTATMGGDQSLGYSGGLDEVMLYDEVLSETEILGLYEQGLAGSGSYLGMSIAADTFSAESNPDDEGTVRDLGTKVGFIRNGSWIRFDDFNFSESASGIEFSASSQLDGGTIEVRTGSPTGELIASVDVAGTGNWNRFRSFSSDFDAPVSGVRDLYFVFENGARYVLDLRSFEVN